MVAIHPGFTRQQKLLVVGCAIFAVFLSLVFAAWTMGGTLQSTQFSQQDQEIVNRLAGNTSDPLHQSILRAHAIDAVSSLKQLANGQSLIIVAFAGAFALCAIGFALLLLGADGVFQLQSGQEKQGLKPWLLGTAPGLLCFVLAVVLVGMAFTQRSSVNLASVYFPKQGVGPLESSTPPSPIGAAPAGNAEAQGTIHATEQRIAAQEAQNRAAEKAAVVKLAAEKAAAEKLIAEKSAAAKAAVEKVAADKLAADKAASAKLIADKAGDAKMAASRAAAKLALDRASTAKLAADRAAADKLAVERAAADKLAAQKAASNKLVAERAASSKLATDKAAGETPRAEKAAADRMDVATLTAEKIAAAGAPAEIHKRALALRSEGETNQALALLRYASSTGHGPSSRLLAMIYRDGAPDVRANFRQAERYQALADAQGAR